jgi:hypothetical protein
MATPKYQRRVKRYLYNAFGSTIYHNVIIAAGVCLLRMEVFLRGTITFSGGTTSGTSVGENPAGLIQQLTVEATKATGGLYPGGTIKKLFPRSILRGNIFDAGRYQDELGGVTVAGAATSYAINLRLPLYFASPSLKVPMESALRLDQFQQVQLQIQNAGAVTAMLTGNDRTVDVSQLYYDVIEYREYTGPLFDNQGALLGPKVMLYETDFYKQILQANTRFSIDNELPKSETYLDALLVTESTNKALVDTILNRATAASGSDEFDDRYEKEIKGDNRDYVKDGYTSTSTTGLYYFNFAEGLLSRSVPDLAFTLDVNNPGTDQILVRTRRCVAAGS